MVDKNSQVFSTSEATQRQVLQRILSTLQTEESVALILNAQDLVLFTHMLDCVPLGHHLSREARNLKRDLRKLHKEAFDSDIPEDSNKVAKQMPVERYGGGPSACGNW